MTSQNLLLSERFSHKKLFDSPTPIQRLNRLERELETNVRLYVKRDDLMGLGGGGNHSISEGVDCGKESGFVQDNRGKWPT